jgi:hypothetical protein
MRTRSGAQCDNPLSENLNELSQVRDLKHARQMSKKSRVFATLLVSKHRGSVPPSHGIIHG